MFGFDDEDFDPTHVTGVDGETVVNKSNDSSRSIGMQSGGPTSTGFKTMSFTPEEIARMVQDSSRSLTHSSVKGMVGAEDWDGDLDEGGLATPKAVTPAIRPTASPLPSGGDDKHKGAGFHPGILFEGGKASLKDDLGDFDWDDMEEEDVDHKTAIAAMNKKKQEMKAAGLVSSPKDTGAPGGIVKNDDASKELHELELPPELQHTLFMTEQFHLSTYGAMPDMRQWIPQKPEGGADDDEAAGKKKSKKQLNQSQPPTRGRTGSRSK